MEYPRIIREIDAEIIRLTQAKGVLTQVKAVSSSTSDRTPIQLVRHIS
jgi:hypothetical protein